MKTRLVGNDLWPWRDKICRKVAYNFSGCDLAISNCGKRDLVIQAGGCVGVWPRYLRTIFSRVLTFEPSEENFTLMVQNLGDLSIEKHLAALGEKEGLCGVKQNPRNCGDDRTIPGTEIPVIAIDDLGLNPDLIYLDIQGDEYPALLGARETLSRCSPVIGIEYDTHCACRQDIDAREWIKDQGYTQVGLYRQDWIYARLT